MSAKPLPADTGPPPGDPGPDDTSGSIAGSGAPMGTTHHAPHNSGATQAENPSTPSKLSQGVGEAPDPTPSSTSDASPSMKTKVQANQNAHDELGQSPSSATSEVSTHAASDQADGATETSTPTQRSGPSTATPQERGFSVGAAPDAHAGRCHEQPRRHDAGNSASQSGRGRPKRVSQTIGGPKPQQAQPTAWTTSGVAQLRSSFRGPAATLAAAASSMPQQLVWRGHPALLKLFEISIAPANLRRDGDQRPMTALEVDAFDAWHAHKLHLAKSPRFLLQTHTTAERDVLNDFQLDHCGFNLYGRLPVGSKISESNAKFEFVHAAVLACGSDAKLRSQVVRMCTSAHTIHCLPASHVVVLRFIYPEDRARWADFVCPFGKSKITLRATDSLTTDVPRVGVDPPARELLHHVFLHGDWQRLRHQQVRAIGAKAAGIPVFDVELIEPTGLTGYAAPKWKLTFDQITCPEALQRVRRIKVTYDKYDYVFEVHHPQLSHRLPCSKCLSVRHATRDCKNVHAPKSLAKHTSTFELAKINPASASMSTTPGKIMGGKHLLMVGDWFQLPPVGGSPCFKRPTLPQSRLRHAGYKTYTAINFVVFLTQNMRARDDPVYTELLSSLRSGRLTDAELALLNSRVHSDLKCDVPIISDEFYRPVVVSTNKLRCAINTDMTFRAARRLDVPVYDCSAVPSSRSRTIVDKLTNARDDQTDHIPIRLLFFLGMPIMVTRKHPDLVEADVVANGVLGRIVGVHPAPKAENFDVTVVDGVEVRKFKQQPKLILVKIIHSRRSFVSGLPPGVIGLPPVRAALKLDSIPNLSQATVTVEQFAMVPAFACTTEKLQGQTCHDGIIVTKLE